jgi:hypothetical protein
MSVTTSNRALLSQRGNPLLPQPAASAVLASEAVSLKSNSKTKTYIQLASLSLLPKVLEKALCLQSLDFR